MTSSWRGSRRTGTVRLDSCTRWPVSVRVECIGPGVFRDGSVCAGEEQVRGRVWSRCPPYPAACHPRGMDRVAEALYGPTAARVGGCSMRLDWSPRASGILLGPPFSGSWPRGFFGRVRSRCCVNHTPGRVYCCVWISIGGGSPLLKAAGHCQLRKARYAFGDCTATRY
jgi:hypothetical protein